MTCFSQRVAARFAARDSVEAYRRHRTSPFRHRFDGRTLRSPSPREMLLHDDMRESMRSMTFGEDDE